MNPTPIDRTPEVHTLRNALNLVVACTRVARIRAERAGVFDVVFPPELLDRIDRAIETTLLTPPEAPAHDAPR